MAMTNRANIKRDGLIMSTLDDLVPQDHLVRTLEATIDWKFQTVDKLNVNSLFF